MTLTRRRLGLAAAALAAAADCSSSPGGQAPSARAASGTDSTGGDGGLRGGPWWRRSRSGVRSCARAQPSGRRPRHAGPAPADHHRGALNSHRTSTPRTMRAQATSPNRLPQGCEDSQAGGVRRARGAVGRLPPGTKTRTRPGPDLHRNPSHQEPRPKGPGPFRREERLIEPIPARLRITGFQEIPMTSAHPLSWGRWVVRRRPGGPAGRW